MDATDNQPHIIGAFRLQFLVHQIRGVICGRRAPRGERLPAAYVRFSHQLSMDARGRKRPAHGTLCGPKPSAYPSDPLQSGITWYRSNGTCRTARQAQNSSVQCRRGVSLWWDQRRTLVGRGIYTRMRDASRTGSRKRSSRSSRCLSDRCPRGAGRSGVCPYDAAPAHLSEHAGQLEVEAAAVAGLVAANLLLFSTSLSTSHSRPLHAEGIRRQAAW